MITTLVAGEINSYRQMPKNFYQIQTKFRDELRPRFGLMRAKEFVMKDAYSFDASDEAAQRSYQKMSDAYVRIFQRCGLRAMPVEADTGVMGGKFSHEFMVPAETGESEVAYCETGDYAANVEKATSRAAQPSTLNPQPSTLPRSSHPRRRDHRGPDPTSLRSGRHATNQDAGLFGRKRTGLDSHARRPSTQRGETRRFPGHGQHPARHRGRIHAALGAHPGSLGAVRVTKLPVYADEVLRGAAGMTTGANEDGFHLRNVDVERDISVRRWADFRLVQAGEPCPVCGQPLKIRRAIEVGHVFKLGTKYSEALGALFLDESGKQKPAVMGCYGIGVTRTMQAIIEQCQDKDGILWPLAVAPYTVCITPLNATPGSTIRTVADKLYADLTGRGVEVIMDDRDERPGVKFKDSELVGFPLRVGIGEKSLARGEVELKVRGGAMVPVKIEEALAKLLELLQGDRACGVSGRPWC